MRTRERLTSEQRIVVDALIEAYREGAFPMADPETGVVSFYTATRRGVFPIAGPIRGVAFHVPRSLRRRLNSGFFDIRCDTDFEGVMRGCASARRNDPESWINEQLIEWYSTLHRAGYAHSVEAWREDEAGRRALVGGIYGVAIGGAFFGESMFSRPSPRLPNGSRHPLDGTDASKVCLARLVEHLRSRGYVLFDTQFTNPHLERFGCVEIPAADYAPILRRAVAMSVTWGRFSAQD